MKTLHVVARRDWRAWLIFFFIITLAFCSGRDSKAENPFIKDLPQASLELVAESSNLWTGVSISREGRIFVCFPRWSRQVPISVGEIVDGTVKPFPDENWNSWIGWRICDE